MSEDSQRFEDLTFDYQLKLLDRAIELARMQPEDREFTVMACDALQTGWLRGQGFAAESSY